MKRISSVKVLAALAILLNQGTLALADASYSTWGSYNDLALNKTSYDSSATNATAADKLPPYMGPWTAMTLPDGYSYSQTSGYANAANLALGVNAWTKSTPSNSYFTEALMRTSASNRFTVSSGTSGLAYGDITTLLLKIRLDGTMHANSAQWPDSGWAHSELNADLAIHDNAIQIDSGEGYYSPALASFGASSEMEAYHVNRNYYSHSYSCGWNESWNTESNILDYAGHSDDWYTQDYQYNGYSHTLDTGEIILAFEAIVGHTLDLDADLYTYVNANNNGEAWADFDNTFKFGVTPATAGLQLDWEISPQAQTVPLPAALPLFGTGLLALFGLRRKMNRS